jgi:hypothetical protein
MDNLKARAEKNFKKEQQAKEGEKAWADYQAQGQALRQRTERLRALRLAKQAAIVSAPKAPKKSPKTNSQ